MVLSAGKTWTSTQANYKRTSIEPQQLSDDDHTQPSESEVRLDEDEQGGGGGTNSALRAWYA